MAQRMELHLHRNPWLWLGFTKTEWLLVSFEERVAILDGCALARHG